MESKGRPIFWNHASIDWRSLASSTQQALPSLRLIKLRYPRTLGSCCAASASWPTCSRVIDPAGTVWARRFELGLRNLFEFYLPLFDRWLLFDNSTLKPRMVALFRGGKLELADTARYNAIVGHARGTRR